MYLPDAIVRLLRDPRLVTGRFAVTGRSTVIGRFAVTGRFAVVRRFAVLAVLASSHGGCTPQLSDLVGTDSSDRDPQDSVTEAIETAPRDSSSTSADPSSWVPAPSTGSTGSTTPPPDCTDGLLNQEGFCVPEVRCAPGTFVSETGGARVCSPCASGEFSNDYDATECRAWRDCTPGQYVERAGSSTADRECAACPSGETTTSPNAGECTGASDCAAGTYKSDDECVTCEPGNYCSGKTDSEVPCESGTWDNDNDPATPCVVKTSCAAGQFVGAEGSTVLDRTCDFCAAETFSIESNAADCEAWSTCEPGTYVSLQGTSTSDRECTECSSGSFASEPNLNGCETWTTCAAPLEYSTSSPDALQDRTCSPCPEGFTAEADNASSCDVPVPANLVTNFDFESNTTGWSSWVGSLSLSTVTAKTGSRSLLVTGPGTGPAATSLDAVVVAGATYNVRFWVNVSKVSTAQVNITRSLTCNGSVSYLWLDNEPAVTSGVWTELAGSFSVPTSCGSPRLQVYAEGGGANVDLYVDDVSVTQAP